MEPSSPAHVLVIAHKTAATPALLEAVRVTTVIAHEGGRTTSPAP
jgi:hypothetical protein